MRGSRNRLRFVRRCAVDIFGNVIFKAMLRAIAAVTALAAGLAGPSSTLAHALEHGRNTHPHDHADSHDRDPAVPSTTTVARATSEQHDHDAGVAVTPVDDDHPHARIDAGLTVRGTTQLSSGLPVIAVVVPALPHRIVADDVDPVVTLIVPTAIGPPPPARAPPSI